MKHILSGEAFRAYECSYFDISNAARELWNGCHRPMVVAFHGRTRNGSPHGVAIIYDAPDTVEGYDNCWTVITQNVTDGERISMLRADDEGVRWIRERRGE